MRWLLCFFFFFGAAYAAPLRFNGLDIARGESFSLEASDGKAATVLVFLSARCPCSESHEAELKRLALEYTEMKFVGLHANGDESAELAREHFLKADLPFPVIRDENQRWANHFKAYKTPHVFVLDRRGEILYSGGVDDTKGSHPRKSFLAEALAAVRKGKKPPTPKTAVLGCEISRN